MRAVSTGIALLALFVVTLADTPEGNFKYYELGIAPGFTHLDYKIINIYRQTVCTVLHLYPTKTFSADAKGKN